MFNRTLMTHGPGRRPFSRGRARAVSPADENPVASRGGRCQASDRAGHLPLEPAQFPQLAGLPVSAVRPAGTVNAIYRLGDHLCARLPRVQQYADDLADEWRWLPWLAPHLSLRVPEPVGQGHPATGAARATAASATRPPGRRRTAVPAAAARRG